MSNEDVLIPGKKIEISAGYHSDEERIFKGVIIKHSVKIRANSALLIIDCKDESVKLTIGRKNNYFYDNTDSDIFETIIDNYGLEKDIESTNYTHKELVQYHTSDWDFMVSRAQANGKLCFVDDGKITIKKPEIDQEEVETVSFGATLLDFDAEIALLKSIRKEFSSKEIELRVDANGAFKPNEAFEKLSILSELDLHSIEQPIKQGQINEMAELCAKTPLPIALDEELIGVFSSKEKKKIITTINPQYIILKPSLIGGFAGSTEWINLAEQNNCGWWITSALESNIGLNAIAQFTYTLKSKLPQGLGTGGLFTNNLKSPLEVKNGALQYNPEQIWDFNL